MDKILAGMMEYFANTSEEQIEKDWQELAEYNQFGPKAKDFVEERLFCGGFFGTQPKIKTESNNPEFSLDFNFYNYGTSCIFI